MEQRSSRKLELYWNRGNKKFEITYRNDGKEISRNEVFSRIKEGDYDGVNISWDGCIPFRTYVHMQTRKSRLERLILRYK